MKPLAASLAGLISIGLQVAEGAAVTSDNARSFSTAGLNADAALSVQDGTNPLQKVIELLTTLQGDVIADGEAEKLVYNEFSKWCRTTYDERKRSIDKGTNDKNRYTAEIQKAKSSIDSLAKGVQKLTGSIANDEADLKAAELLRTHELTNYQAMDQQMAGIIETIDRAIEVLERKDSTGFLQRPNRGMELFDASISELIKAAAVFSESDRSRLQSAARKQRSTEMKIFAGTNRTAALAADAGDGNTEDVSRGNRDEILELLRNMRDNAVETQANERKKELNRKQHYELFKQHLESKIKSETERVEQDQKDSASASENLAENSLNLKKTTDNLATDLKNLDTLQRDCMGRASLYEENMRTRQMELKALADAKKEIQDSSFVQTARRHRKEGLNNENGLVPSFLQVSRKAVSPYQKVGAQLLGRLRRIAKKSKSLALAQLASRVSTLLQSAQGSGQMANPFTKISKMLQNMIIALEKELKEETSQKKFCDLEMSETLKSRGDKTEDIDEKQIHLEGLAAREVKIQEDLQRLSRELQSNAESQSEMDRIHQEEQQDFNKARQDFETGLNGVQRALNVLRDYYNSGTSNAGSTFFVEESARQHSGASTTGAGQAIISLIEVVEADFAKSLTETTSMQQAAIDQFEKDTQENKVSTATKETEVKHLNKDLARLGTMKSQLSSDQLETQEELDAINEYYEKLKSQCIEEDVDFGDRAAKKEAEIQELTEALQYLDSAS